jgi:MerR family transcriptional regulator, light-induced transcriptional regulator
MNSSPTSPDRLSMLAAAFTEALLSGDPRTAELVVRDAIDAGLSQGVIDEAVIAPAMREVGELWKRGDITVADEHLATDISFRVLAMQREAFRVAGRRKGKVVLLAAVETEQHVLGLEMAGSLLDEAGFDVRMLGADLPIETLRDLVERYDPAVFGFTVTMEAAADLLPLAIEETRRGAPSIRVVVGGQGVPRDLDDTYWLTVVDGVTAVVDEVDALLHRPSLN